MTTEIRKPGKRVDGANHIDLKAKAERRKIAAATRKLAPPLEDTRVADAWTREDGRANVALRAYEQQRRMRKVGDGGKDGASERITTVKISTERASQRTIRCRSGSFEWRYSTKRGKNGHLFDAGSYLAQLWEKAGMAIPSSANFLRGIASGYQTSVSEGRLAAIDKLDGIRVALGHGRSERLIDYVVAGMTAGEIAVKYQIGPRDVAAVLHQDLRDCWEVTFGPRAAEILRQKKVKSA